MHTAEAAAAPAAAPAAPAWISMPDQANSCLIAQILMLDQAWQATVCYIVTLRVSLRVSAFTQETPGAQTSCLLNRMTTPHAQCTSSNMLALP